MSRPSFSRTVPDAGTPTNVVYSRDIVDSGVSEPVAEGAGSFAIVGKHLEASYSESVSGTYTVNLSNGSVHELTLTGNTTITLPSVIAGRAQSFVLILTQDSTGGRTTTFSPTPLWSGGTAPSISTVASSVSVLTFMSVGSSWVGFLAGTDVA